MDEHAKPVGDNSKCLLSRLFISLLVVMMLLQPVEQGDGAEKSGVVQDGGSSTASTAMRLAQTGPSAEPETLAGVVKCIQADGSVIYTDSPRRADCRGEITAVEGGSSVSIIARPPAAAPRSQSSKPKAGRQTTYPPPRQAPSSKTIKQVRCRRFEQRLERVRSLMRAGYKAHEYNRLMERKRKAKAGIADNCD